VSWSEWMADAKKLAAVDRAHREAKNSSLVGKQLVPVGKISRFFTICLAIAVGALMLMPVESDVPIYVVVITGLMLSSYAPFESQWQSVTDFEQLHAPPAGLLLLRLRRLAPYLTVIGLIWAVMLSTTGSSWWAITAIGLMPFAMSFANMIRADILAYVLRVLIATTFLLGWMHLIDWMPIVTLVLDVVVVVWWVRDLGVYDREGFQVEEEIVDQIDAVRAEVAAERPLPDVRASKRRSLIGNAWFVALAAQRDMPGLWLRRPVAVTVSNIFVASLWLAPVALAVWAVWRTETGVDAFHCVGAAVLSLSFLSLDRNEQLYLWGVDMQKVERHNVWMRLMEVALPSVAAAVVAVSLMGASEQRWTTVLFLVGVHLARIGLGAFNFSTALILFVAMGIGLLVASGGTAMDQKLAFYAALVLAVFGIIGIMIRMFRSEGALREHTFA